ncbi:PDS5, regulator of cohesion maintenance [Musa troglodytarum]|uniref:PDS5, regulator of cohesion maintenance n=1 Tax=Musa troglodytarum TaxID=320322 RepID=A0A9E7LAA0_9LILI|nr:PDS5, regulator of cohesion maintenance [Musa troglodytarum]
MVSKEKELEDRLREVGSRLVSPPSVVDELLPLLDQTESLLSRVEQSPTQSMSNALRPSMKALVAKELLGHSDIDVKVAVASCISEITRITAPEAPYDDDLMKEIFQRIVEAFENLDDMSSHSFPKRVSILETVAKVRSCVVMLDLECDSLILEMFRYFLNTIRPNHSEKIFSSMEMIMTLVLEESEDISSDLILCLLDSVKTDNKDILPVVRRLSEKVISNCAGKLKPYIVELTQSIGTPLNKYGKVVASICQENSGGVEQNDANVSGEIVGSAKMEQATGCPEEITITEKSSKSVTSNGIVQIGNGESTVEPSSPEQKPEPSCHGDQFERDTAPNRVVSVLIDGSLENEEPSSKHDLSPPGADSGAVKDSTQSKSEIPDATRRKRGRPSSKLAATKPGGSGAAERCVPPLQQKGSDNGNKTSSTKDSDLKKESDGIGDSDNIEKPATVTRDFEGKSQRQTSRKGSTGKSDHGDSSQRLRTSKIKQQDSLKAKKDTAGEPVLKISETPTLNKEMDESLVGSTIRVWWPMDKKFYDGVVDSYDHTSKKHKVIYNDGDVEILLLKKERWEFIKNNKIHVEQAKVSIDPDASSEEPRSKRTKTSSSSIQKERIIETPAKSHRRGRPPKAAVSNLDDNPSTSGKLKEKATSKSKDGSFRSGTKIKDDDKKSKGGIFKDKSTSKTRGGSKDNAHKSIRKSVDGTPKSTGRSTDSVLSASSKVKKDAPKGKSSADSTKTGLKSRGITTLKTGSESKSNVASEKGKAKVRESETLGKVRSDTTPKVQESEALAGKKRKRKVQT